MKKTSRQEQYLKTGGVVIGTIGWLPMYWKLLPTVMMDMFLMKLGKNTNL